MRINKALPRLALILAGLAASAPALAHPHIWIEARSVLVFDGAGALSAIRHSWTFDEAFSAWSIQGLDTDNDGQISEAEFADLAAENMSGLQSFDYYTFAGAGQDDIPLVPTGDQRISFDGSRTTLHFSLAPQQPVPIGQRFEIEVTDPEYYAAFSFADDGATLENAPAGCSVTVNAPKPIDPALEQRLFELGPDVTELPAELKGAAEDLANALILTCAEGSAATAEQAISQAAPASNRPFVAPPAERGLPVARSGFLGWVNQQQQSFYAALTGALGALRSDNNAFWVLGTLSFLYGIFHAAGPGHGKLVISAYMLATEAELRRGIGLSFAASLVQSLTAIVFVSVAALLFNLTSSALSAASNVLITGSYVLVAALGLWLVLRKLFGWGGHTHGGHAHTHDHDHAHGHDDHDHHHHAITPADSQGGLKEMLGVVLAVGLRPCSGALVVLVFALSQGVYPAGIAAVFLMGLGTALTVSVLAMVAVGIKGTAGLFAGGPHAALAARAVWWLELTGAALVLALGVVLLMANL